MSAIISSTVFTIVDQAGNPRTEAVLVCEYRENYEPGGIAFNLSPYFRRIEHILTSPISGGRLRTFISGAAVTEGVFLSGDYITALPVTDDYATPASSRVKLIGVNVFSGSNGARELVSGATSGVRFLARALGY